MTNGASQYDPQHQSNLPYGPPTDYRDPTGYDSASPYDQPNPYGQPNPYEQAPAYGQPPHPQPTGYGTPHPAQYGHPMPYVAYHHGLPEHPQSTTVLILGVLSLVVGVTAPVAWFMGSKAKREIAEGAPYSFGTPAVIGHIIGIIVSILGALYLAFVVIMFSWLFLSF